MLQLFELWELGDADRLGLLGFPEGDNSPLRELETQGVFPDDVEKLNRISLLFSIHLSLKTLYQNPEMVHSWLTMRNAASAYRTPLDVIKATDDGLLRVRGQWI